MCCRILSIVIKQTMLKIASLEERYDQYLTLWNLQPDNENIPAILIFIDFKKVFDAVEWYNPLYCLMVLLLFLLSW